MRKVAFALLFALALGLLVLPALASGKTHDMKAEVVSMDMKTNMITLKDEKGETKTAPVLEPARASLRTLKAGDHVLVTCQDDDKGQHQGVSAIRVQPVEHKG